MLMCRNIKTLHNFAPPATEEEIRASALQFVRKLSGCTRPSNANQAAFSRAVDQVTQAAHELLESLVTDAPPRDREVEAAKARAAGQSGFGRPSRACHLASGRSGPARPRRRRLLAALLADLLLCRAFTVPRCTRDALACSKAA
jgi:hypothetical protein